MPRSPPQSYLMRLWREHGGASLRATLIAVGRPEAHQYLADMEALCAFLHAQTDPGAHSTGGQVPLGSRIRRRQHLGDERGRQ